MKKLVLGIMLMLFLVGMLSMAFNIELVWAGPKTWIVDDNGPADFHTIAEARLHAAPGDIIYVKEGIYYERLCIYERNLTLIGENPQKTVIDGNGTGFVIYVDGRTYGREKFFTISGFTIRNSGSEALLESGIFIDDASHCFIVGNIIAHNQQGILLYYSNNITVCGNIIKDSYAGVTSGKGIYLFHAHNNTIYHNNFINNTKGVLTYYSYNNTWNNNYLIGGNYWSDYTGTDLYNGPDQDETGSDGIGDTPYVIDENNIDNYPLMGYFSNFNVTSEFHVQTICNSTITGFQFNGTAIGFDVTGENGTTGFCRICIPTALMGVTYKVYVNGIEVSYDLLPCSNSTHSYLYFTYKHSTRKVIIIPEFPSNIAFLGFLMLITIPLIFIKKKRYRKTKP